LLTTKPPFAETEPHLTERELAARWRTSLRTLQRRRRSGAVPAYMLLGRSVLYPIGSVLTFEAARLQSPENLQ
jgi:hypothetical protein